jgi:type I restriction enzyme, S subunit
MSDRISEAEVPEGWAGSTVAECFLDIRNGTTASQNKEAHGVPVSRIETIQQDQFDFSRVQHIADASPSLLDKFRYRKGDIALSHINSFEHVGKTAVYEGYPEVFVHGMNLLRLRLGHVHALPRFLHFFMRTSRFRDEVRLRAGQAVNQVSINQPNLGGIVIPLAPLPEQQRIVSKVEALLARVNVARQRLAKVPAILKRFRQSVLAAACSGRLTADWREEQDGVESAASILEQIDRHGTARTESLYLIENDLPDGWVSTVLDNVSVKITDGEHLTPKTTVRGVPLVSAKDVRDDGVNFSDVKYVSSQDAARFRTRCCPGLHDILVVSRGATIGRVSAVQVDRVFCLMGSVILINPSPLVDKAFMALVLKSPQSHGRLVDLCGHSAQQAIYIRDIRKLPITIPPLSEQHEIVRRVDALLRLADAIENRVAAATARADKLTQAILAKAFKGELVTTEAELARREGRSYEPASALLERVRTQHAVETTKQPSRAGNRKRKC